MDNQQWDEILPGVWRRGNEFTNVVDREGAPTMDLGNPSPASLGNLPDTLDTPDTGLSSSSSNFHQILGQLEKEKDPKEKFKMFASLQEAAAMEAARIKKDTYALAEEKVGLPALMQTLAQNEQQDRLDPKWAQFQSDSPITAKVRKQVDAQRLRANMEADNLLSTNLTLNAMDAKLKTMGKLLEIDYKAQERRDTIQLQKDMREEEALAQMPDFVLKRIRASEPLLKEATDREVAGYFLKAPQEKRKMWTASKEDLLQEAVIGNDAEAERMYLSDLAASGTSPAAALDHMTRMKQNAFDDSKLVTTFATLNKIATDDPALKSFNSMAAAFRNGALDKTGTESYKAQKFRMLDQLARVSDQISFQAHADKWPIADPDFLTAVGKAKELGGTDFHTVAAAYLGNTAGKERAARAEKLKGFVDVATVAHNANSVVKLSNQQIWNSFLAKRIPEAMRRYTTNEFLQVEDTPYNRLILSGATTQGEFLAGEGN